MSNFHKFVEFSKAMVTILPKIIYHCSNKSLICYKNRLNRNTGEISLSSDAGEEDFNFGLPETSKKRKEIQKKQPAVNFNLDPT